MSDLPGMEKSAKLYRHEGIVTVQQAETLADFGRQGIKPDIEIIDGQSQHIFNDPLFYYKGFPYTEEGHLIRNDELRRLRKASSMLPGNGPVHPWGFGPKTRDGLPVKPVEEPHLAAKGSVNPRGGRTAREATARGRGGMGVREKSTRAKSTARGRATTRGYGGSRGGHLTAPCQQFPSYLNQQFPISQATFTMQSPIPSVATYQNDHNGFLGWQEMQQPSTDRVHQYALPMNQYLHGNSIPQGPPGGSLQMPAALVTPGSIPQNGDSQTEQMQEPPTDHSQQLPLPLDGHSYANSILPGQPSGFMPIGMSSTSLDNMPGYQMQGLQQQHRSSNQWLSNSAISARGSMPATSWRFPALETGRASALSPEKIHFNYSFPVESHWPSIAQPMTESPFDGQSARSARQQTKPISPQLPLDYRYGNPYGDARLETYSSHADMMPSRGSAPQRSYPSPPLTPAVLNTELPLAKTHFEQRLATKSQKQAVPTSSMPSPPTKNPRSMSNIPPLSNPLNSGAHAALPSSNSIISPPVMMDTDPYYVQCQASADFGSQTSLFMPYDSLPSSAMQDTASNLTIAHPSEPWYSGAYPSLSTPVPQPYYLQNPRAAASPDPNPQCHFDGSLVAKQRPQYINDPSEDRINEIMEEMTHAAAYPNAAQQSFPEDTEAVTLAPRIVRKKRTCDGEVKKA